MKTHVKDLVSTLTHRILASVLLVATGLASSCGSSDESLACDAIGFAGITARITTSDGADVARLTDLVVEVRDGDYVERSSPPDMNGLAFERAGTYSVTVTHPCYETWSRDGVVVEQGTCNVHQVELDVVLQRRACDEPTRAEEVVSEVADTAD